MCAHATTSASVPASSEGDGEVPAGPSTICGSSNQGACLEALANFEENSPKLKCADLLLIRPNVAASQKAVAPPKDKTISYPSGREKSSDSPSRTSPTTFLTAGWRWEVPMTSCAPLTTASICAWRTLEGPQPKRPSEGMRSGESLKSGLVMPGVYGGMNNM